jgi:hypothetical protein
MQLYKTDSNLNPVPWTSLLYPEYVSTNKVYQCPADINKELNKNLSDNDSAWLERIDNDWSDVYDRPSPGVGKSIGVNDYRHNDDAKNVSYFYEMSNMLCTFGDFKYSDGTTVPSSVSGLPTNPTWAEWKEIQLNHGGDDTNPWGTPYSVSAFPIYRCFWHIKHVKDYASPNTIPNPAEPVINITYGGNYVITKMHWEEGVWNP